MPNNYSSQFFTQIDVGTETGGHSPSSGVSAQVLEELCNLMRQMISKQQKNNELLENLLILTTASQHQRGAELAQWRAKHSGLAKNCQKAAENLGKIQTDYLNTLTQEIEDNAEAFEESDYMLNEFLDRFGPRFAHLNGIFQLMSQLGGSAGDDSASK